MNDQIQAPTSTNSPNFRALFESMPGLHLLLALDFSIVAVSDAYLKATLTTREALLRRDVFPSDFANPDTYALRVSVERVRLTRSADAMPLQKLVLRKQDCKGGDLEERIWSRLNLPVFGDDGGLQYILHCVDDVTERTRAAQLHAERSLASDEVRVRLAAIIESSNDAIVSRSLEGVVTSWNPAAEKIFGYTAAEMIGQKMSPLFPAALVNEEIHISERLRRRERIDHFDTVRRRKDGSEIDVSVSVSPLKDQFGEVVGASTIVRDISAAKRSAAERASLATRATTVLEAVADGIVTIDENGTLNTFNRAAEKILGYQASEVLGKNIQMLMPELRPSLHAGFLVRDGGTERSEGGASGREIAGARKDGSRVPLELSMTEMWLDGKRFYTGLLRDISERKAADAAFAKKNHELEVAARSDRMGARVMVALNQQDSSTQPANEVLRVLADEAGYRPLAFYEYDEWQGSLVLGASLSLGLGSAQKIFKVGEGLVGEAAAARAARFVDSPIGTAFSLETGVGVLAAATLFAIPLLHQEKLLGVLVGASQARMFDRERSMIAQVAGQVAIGLHAVGQFQELKRLSEQLNERTRKIEAQNRELAHATRLKSEFLSSMSHELRTPLNAIIGFSEALKDSLLGELTPEQLDYVTEVFQSGKHLLSLINDMLDLSKIEAGKMELFVERVAVAALVQNALAIVREAAAEGGITLTQNIATESTWIDADGRKLRQILYNLLSNAVKFTPRGGHVHLDVKTHGSDIEFAVIDSGVGISADGVTRLFRPFEQLDGGLARKFAGTGLGLVMVKNLVELHAGTLGVESETGKGSRFWIRLSAVRSDTHASSSTPPPSPSVVPPSGPAAHVLVIDDDHAAVSFARKCLEKEGYSVDDAETCDSAWLQIEKRAPDAILLDILFGNGPSGWEFLERLRSAPAFADIPVVIVSIAADLGRGLALGALQVLQKPLGGSDLLRAVESLGLAPSNAGHAPHVLVVDDDPRAVEHVSKRLEHAGLAITRAYGGKDALAAVAGSSFSAVVLDLMMPEVSGFEVIRELRAHPATTDLPIIVLTAKLLEPREQAKLADSVHSVLGKGEWDEARFLQVIRSAIHVALRNKTSRSEHPSLASP